MINAQFDIYRGELVAEFADKTLLQNPDMQKYKDVLDKILDLLKEKLVQTADYICDDDGKVDYEKLLEWYSII